MVEKKKIGHLAAELVKENMAIFVEGGTTLLEMVLEIKAKDVTVVTPDLNIALALADNSAITTVVLGGYIWQGTYILIGDLAEQNIRNMHFSYYFTSPGGITDKGELLYYNIQLSNIRDLGQKQSDQLVVVCDDSKYGKAGFICSNTISDVDVLVTNRFPLELRKYLSPNVCLYILEK